eukprot:scaffold129027_cov54-Phaeocystis_antarctica.AAC.1
MLDARTVLGQKIRHSRSNRACDTGRERKAYPGIVHDRLATLDEAGHVALLEDPNARSSLDHAEHQTPLSTT